MSFANLVFNSSVIKVRTSQSFNSHSSSILFFPHVQIGLIKTLKIQQESQVKNISAEDLKFIKTCWSRLQKYWPNNYAEKILPFCVQTAELIPNLDEETVSSVSIQIILVYKSLVP